MSERQAWIEDRTCAVPLGPAGGKGTAVLSPEDYAMLCELGLSKNWNLSPRGYVVAPCCRAPGSSVLVARVLMDCRPGQNIIYLDKNRKNLLRSNLAVKRNGYALSRPRDFLKRADIALPGNFEPTIARTNRSD